MNTHNLVPRKEQLSMPVLTDTTGAAIQASRMHKVHVHAVVWVAHGETRLERSRCICDPSAMSMPSQMHSEPLLSAEGERMRSKEPPSGCPFDNIMLQHQ